MQAILGGRMKIRIMAGVWAVGLAVVLAACTGEPANPPVGAPPSPAGDAAPTPVPTPAQFEDCAGTTQDIGAICAYPDGLAVQVASVLPFTPSANAAGLRPGHTAVAVTVQFRNGTDKPLDLSMSNVTLRAGKAGTVAAGVGDIAQDVVGGLTGRVAPGKNATGKIGFAVAKTDIDAPVDDVVVEVIPGFLTYEPVLFEGPVGFR